MSRARDVASIVQGTTVFSGLTSSADAKLLKGDSSAISQYFQNSTTGSGGTDGVQIALGSSEDFQIWNYENTALTIATNNAEALKIDANGHITMVKQPAFLVKPDANQDGLAINTYHTVQFDEEVFDQNADFNTSTYTFTAPVTGRYQLNTSVYLYNIDKDADYILIFIETSNRSYSVIFDPGGYAADINYQSWVQTVVADMDASDTAVVKVYQQAGAAQSNLIAGNYTWFSGVLVA